MIKTNELTSARVVALLIQVANGRVDGNCFVEQFHNLAPDEQAQLVAGLLSAYKAVCEDEETIH